MGSGTSKESPSQAAAGGGRRARVRVRVFNSSCFGLPSTLSDDQSEDENGRSKGKNCRDEEEGDLSGDGGGPCRKLGFPRLSNAALLNSSDLEPSRRDLDDTRQIDSGASGSSTAALTVRRSSIQSSARMRSRFGFNPDGFGFRLSRTASMGSSAAQTHYESNRAVPDSNAADLARIYLNGNSSNRSDTAAAENAALEAHSSPELVGSTASSETHRNNVEHENYFEVRRSSRRLAIQESLEGSARFSRTRSVGRLRDRVLQGTSFSEGLFGPASLEDGLIGHIEHPNRISTFSARRRAPSSSNRSSNVLPDSSNDRAFRRPSPADSGYSRDTETSQLREAGSRDLLEHRSLFLERRRRIRSQVRALQRLGSRFENLSGHDRSCILSGQHGTSRCTCRLTNPPANPDDNTSTRASISRIVMLAEALFEVLDEIHQQSVVLSSRPSFSSIGSVPAPKDVVECMPLKVYTKQHRQQNEETEQCYICLVEYEEGDCLRILPCNHEFHQICIDKWLKEIHRVCPLCRGDVCRTDVSSMEKLR